MNELNYFYVKVQDFISKTKDIKELAPVLKKIGRISPKDTFTRVKNEITIEDDWITFAESKMKYVEAAVYENRQFIRDDGEVLPIDRVKKISRSSVEHLAKHTDYIEKYNPEEDELVPSKIYTVNKDTDYGVYENKFLYLLLVTLTDFISRERDEISSSLKQESGVFTIKRYNDLLEDDVAIEINMSFKTADTDMGLPEEEKDKLVRMENLKGRAQALLSTPLMQIVAREPMISTSITKTNVLTMNENFSNSLELYELLINYDKKSYSCKKTSLPLVVQSEFSFPILALELLVKTLKDDAEKEYEESSKSILSEERNKAIEDLNKRLAEIKSKYKDDPEAYIILLEDKITLLGGLNVEIADLRIKLDDMTHDRDVLAAEKKRLEEKINVLNTKVSELSIRIGNFEAEKEQALVDADRKIKEQAEEIENLNKTITSQNKIIEKLEDDNRVSQKQLEYHQEKIDELSKANGELSTQLSEIKSIHDEELAKKDEEIRLLKARLTGIQAEAGELKPEEADTKKEAFDELEREYDSFTAYFEAVWDKTKLEIKKQIKQDLKRKRG